ncbi:MAG: cell envelope integrity protein TolA, partial [Arsenophonus sp.]
ENTKKDNKQKKINKETLNQSKIEKNQLIKEQIEKKERAEIQIKKEDKTRNIKLESETKIKTKKTTKIFENNKKIDPLKQDDTVNNLLNRLTSQYLTQKPESTLKSEDQEGNKKKLVSSSDLANYVSMVKAAIESKFYDFDIYIGKICELNIKLSPKGKLVRIAVTSNTSNDQSLCDAAIHVAKTAMFPKPPSRSIYNAFNSQESILVFKKN